MKKPYSNYIASLILATATLHSSVTWAQMQHGEMQMQGGSAPADARDPNAYSDGYTLTEGPYAQTGPRQLVLADEYSFWSILADRLEYQSDPDSTLFDLQGWYGTTYDRFTVKTEGEIADSRVQESETQLLWSHALTPYFDTQAGLRLDQHHEGTDRQWLALGMQGLAPYWFELDITAYLGESGRTALNIEVEYELLLTQRLILQPRMAMNLYGKNDDSNGIGSGLSGLSIGLRLRYEFSRQFAPYIGVQWSDAYGDTADYQKADDRDIADTQFVAGLRFWF
jgi:copper resistance protein B